MTRYYITKHFPTHGLIVVDADPRDGLGLTEGSRAGCLSGPGVRPSGALPCPNPHRTHPRKDLLTMNRNHRAAAGVAAATALLAVAAGACTSEPSAIKTERKATQEVAQAFATNQPMPVHSWSQQRQTLIDIITMQVETTATFSYFFTPGRADAAPVYSCPSIGDPIPSTYQLTNPEASQWDSNGGNFTLPQMEPTGVYSGDTDGTNVLCVKDDGTRYKVYWEGLVMTTTLELRWDEDTLNPIAGATSTYEFNKGK